MEKLQLSKKIEEIVSSLGYLLIELAYRGDNHLRIIEIYIDNEIGITTDDCSSVSRVINEAIELESLIDSSYRIDVSSPGIERSLKFLLQYSKHVSRKFEVDYKVGEETKKLVGKLIRVDGTDLLFDEKKSEVKINFENVINAKVIISF